MRIKKDITLEELARAIGGALIGNRNLTVNNIADTEKAGSGDLVFILRKKLEPLLENTKASCAVVPLHIDKAPIPVIKCKNPNLAFKKAVELILPDHIPHPKGIHPTAFIGENVTLGKDVTIGALAVVEEKAHIAGGTIIYAHCYVGCSTSIGKNCVIYPNVTIRENVKIGDGVIIHAGCIIGADGFGYEMTETGREKIPHIGDVIIENDVELGACVTVDRGKIAHTKIGQGTKIDNLVQIAHNVTIGQNCIIVAQCGISGSVKIGDNVVIGGQVGVADHLEIGEGAIIAAQAGIMKSVTPNAIMWGIPARPLKKAKKIYALFDKLPEIYERLKGIEKKLETLNPKL